MISVTEKKQEEYLQFYTFLRFSNRTKHIHVNQDMFLSYSQVLCLSSKRDNLNQLVPGISNRLEAGNP